MKPITALFLTLALFCTQAHAQALHVSSGQPRSTLVPNFLGGTESLLLNQLKTAQNWVYADNSGPAGPDDLDASGYPVYGANGFLHSGFYTVTFTFSQAMRPGHYVLIGTGQGQVRLSDQFSSYPTMSTIACTGTASGLACSNAACSSFQGSIAGTTLTVTSQPTGSGCRLRAGVPISGSGVIVNQWGVPTIITSAGSPCGANTCYSVNFAQSVPGESMTMGFRLEVAAGNSESTTATSSWRVDISRVVSGNTIGNMALLHVNDESLYWQGDQLVGPLFKTRVAQLNPAYLRDLDLSNQSYSNCTTWGTRKPIKYFSYAATEMRNASSGPGQFANSSGTGASGGTISYNAATDSYSITLGSGNWTDKQTIIVRWPATGTTASRIGLNGNKAIAPLTPYGSSLAAIGTAFVPTNGYVATLVYDATLGAPLIFGGPQAQGFNTEGLDCGVPPEVFIEISAELKTQPFIELLTLALDPMTDWVKSHAQYIRANAPNMVPVFELNEPWNCSGVYPASYASAKSRVYISQDSAWVSGSYCGKGGNFNDWVGKVMSTTDQDLYSVFGAGNYQLWSPLQTAGAPGASLFKDVLLSSGYVNQTRIPVQSGYRQTPAYQYVTRLSVNNYWSPGYFETPNEVALAYCYFYQASGCASQTSAMAAYVQSTLTTGSLGIGQWLRFLSQWNMFAQTCGATSRPSNCVVSQTTPLGFYEGGYNVNLASADVTQTVTSATNAERAVLAAGGCVSGMPVSISNATGGTWSTAKGNYNVQSATSSTCTINLNSTGLGALTSLTLTYTGSANYVSYLRQMSYLSPQVYNLTLYFFNQIVAKGGINPAQFNMSNTISARGGWAVFAPDIYGYFPVAQCTGCTVSGTALTLGGTVSGIFAAGQVLLGQYISGPGTGAANLTTITACALGTGNRPPCGANSGDTLALSQAPTRTIFSGETMTGNIVPPTDAAGNATDSPIAAWPAIRMWNGNIGGYLLGRDLDPSGNDNSPVGLGGAA